MSDVTERDQFSGAVQEIQTLFFNVFAKYENFESDQNKNTELIEALRTQLQYSEKKRSEIQAKYTNLRVSLIKGLSSPCSKRLNTSDCAHQSRRQWHSTRQRPMQPPPPSPSRDYAKSLALIWMIVLLAVTQEMGKSLFINPRTDLSMCDLIWQC